MVDRDPPAFMKRHSPRLSSRAFWVLVGICACIIPLIRSTTNFTSVWDEHAHLSYVQYVHDFKWPASGYPMNAWGREAFACHPHQLYGPMAQAACGENGPGNMYPTGGANTAEGWPPIAYVAIANLSRPIALFVDDPLHAARVGVVALWGLGMLCLAKLARKNGQSDAFIIGWVLAMSSLPGIAYFSSFVSPYSSIPLLAAYAIWSTLWIFQRLNDLKQPWTRADLVPATCALMFPAISVLTVPHSISIVIAISIALGLYAITNLNRKNPKESALRMVVASTTAFVLAFGANRAYRFYVSYNARRSIPYPVDTNPDVAPPTMVHDQDWLGQGIQRAWDFFPNALHSALPVNRSFEFTSTLFIWGVVGVILAAALGLSSSRNAGFLATGVIVASPVSALVFYYSLTFEPPPRYGLPLALFGSAIVLIVPASRRATRIFLTLATILAVFAVVNEPIYIEQPCWQVGESGYLELCESS